MKKLLLLSLLCPVLASAQTLLWANNLGAGQSDGSLDLMVDASGNSYVTGYFSNTVDFNTGSGTANRTSQGGRDVFVASYDANGNYRWASTMGNQQDDFGYGIALDGNGNVFITGKFAVSVDADPGAGVQTLTATAAGTFVWKLNAANGNYVDAFAIDGFSAGNDIAASPTGQVAITGVFDGTADFDPGNGVTNLIPTGGMQDTYVALYDNTLNFSWAFALTGTDEDKGWRVLFDATGNLYVSGYTRANLDMDPGSGVTLTGYTGGTDAWIASYSNTGTFSWGFSLRSSGDERINALAIDNNLLYIGGYHGGTVDFDPSGATANPGHSGGQDIFFAQYTTAGTYNWAKHIGDGTDQGCEAICVMPGGDLGITGYFGSDIIGLDFNPGNGNYTVTSAGGSDIFVSRFDAQGNFSYVFTMGSSTAGDIGYAIQQYGNSLLVSGLFVGFVDFDPAGATLTYNGPTGNAYVARYDATFIGIPESTIADNFIVYPNPITNADGMLQLVVATSTPPDRLLVRMTDVQGKEVRSLLLHASGNRFSLPVDQLPPGIYLLHMQTDEQVVTRKIVIR